MSDLLGPFKLRLDNGEWVRDADGAILFSDGQDHTRNLALFYADLYRRSVYVIDKLTGTFVMTIRPEDVNWGDWGDATKIDYLNGQSGRQ